MQQNKRSYLSQAGTGALGLLLGLGDALQVLVRLARVHLSGVRLLRRLVGLGLGVLPRHMLALLHHVAF